KGERVEQAFYVDIVGSEYVVMRARPNETPAPVAGPFYTAIAAWKDAERRAAMSGQPVEWRQPAPAYVPRTAHGARAAWVVLPVEESGNSLPMSHDASRSTQRRSA